MNDDKPCDADGKRNSADKDGEGSNDTKPLVVTIEPQTKTKYSYEAKHYRLDHARYRLEKKSYRTAHWTMVFLIIYTGLTLIVAVSSVVATFYTKRSIRQTHENFQQDERPYVWPAIEGPEIKLGVELTSKIYFINYGKTPALKFKSVSMIIPGAVLSANKADTAMTRAKIFFENVDKTLASEPDKGQIVVMQHVPEDARLADRKTLSYGGFAPSDREGVRELMGADYSYVIVGKAVYFDGFGKSYWTTFCMTSVKGNATLWCDSYNEIH